MKIGITIPNYYDRYIEEIAKLNNLSKTAVCGLIVENFLSFNKARKSFPIFKQDIKIVFAKTPEQKLEGALYAEVEEPEMSREEILASLESED